MKAYKVIMVFGEKEDAERCKAAIEDETGYRPKLIEEKEE